MYYEFYIDQFAAEHFISGCLLFMITSRVLRRKVPRWRIVTGSMIQTAGMLLFILLGVPKGYPAAYIAAGICTFGGIKSRFFYALGVYAAVVLCFGGILRFVMQLSGVSLLTGSLMAAAGVYMTVLLWQQRRIQTENFRYVTLWIGDRCIRLLALLDTGNSLREPLTGKPVSIISEAAAEQVLEKDWEQIRGCFLIPFFSLGTESAWMKGFSVPSMQVEKDGKKTEVKNVILAVYQGRISGNGSYQMILHPEHADNRWE